MDGLKKGLTEKNYILLKIDLEYNELKNLHDVLSDSKSMVVSSDTENGLDIVSDLKIIQTKLDMLKSMKDFIEKINLPSEQRELAMTTKEKTLFYFLIKKIMWVRNKTREFKQLLKPKNNE